MSKLDYEIQINEIVKLYLEEHDLAGLYNPEIGCCCPKEDIFMCEEPSKDCVVCYKGWHKAEFEDDWEGECYWPAVGDVHSPCVQHNHPRLEHNKNN